MRIHSLVVLLSVTVGATGCSEDEGPKEGESGEEIA